MNKQTATDHSRPSPQRRADNAATAKSTTPNPVDGRAGERLPYTPPAIEVIEVRTEHGYALSGAPRPWDPIPW